MRLRIALSLAILAMLAAACSQAAADTVVDSAARLTTTTTLPTASTSTVPEPTTASTEAIPPTTTTTIVATTTTISPFARPDWLGTRLLEVRSDGWGVAEPTPAELADRRLETLDLLPPPTSDVFTSTIGPIPDDVLARSSWREECPVGVDDLVYLTMSHYGFDGEVHTGEMIVNAAVGQDIIGVFSKLHAARFPIEQMRVVTADEFDGPPTGDWNGTTSFACRRSVGSGRWSQHAYGLAIDINQFHNPYVKGDLVLPELASAYLNRNDLRPGMITAGDVVDQAFAEIGWAWGGRWSSLKDWMHFSLRGN